MFWNHLYSTWLSFTLPVSCVHMPHRLCAVLQVKYCNDHTKFVFASKHAFWNRSGRVYNNNNDCSVQSSKVNAWIIIVLSTLVTCWKWKHIHRPALSCWPSEENTFKKSVIYSSERKTAEFQSDGGRVFFLLSAFENAVRVSDSKILFLRF